MLINFENNIATVICNTCKTEKTHDLTNHVSVLLEEFGQYENLMLPCSNCNTIEGFNVNIPLEEDMSNMPQQEITQRTHLREIIKSIREDFKNV